MGKVIFVVLAAVFLSGCASIEECGKCFLGISTKELEEYRKDAEVKVFDYGYSTCYEKAENIIRQMPKAEIYAKDAHMIAFYFCDPNVTSVGVFFKEIDATHTRVEISSAGRSAREWVAKNIFSGKVLKPTVEIKPKKDSDPQIIGL